MCDDYKDPPQPGLWVVFFLIVIVGGIVAFRMWLS